MASPSDHPSASEEVDLVDDQDQVVGSAILSDCLTKGLLHRAVAVLVVRKNGSVLLQERSHSDVWNPGLWTLSCTGHVKRGETYTRAASRELSEELGLTASIREIWKVKLPPMRDRMLTEHEWVTLFTAETDARATPDPEELAGVREVDRSELERVVEFGNLTEDAKILLRRYLK
jgi:isopentenyldiphosphate isomerase